MPDKWLIAIGGPTASGKTGLAIQLARRYGTEIISADSRQLYKEMNIGTAKPSPMELAMAPHYFIDHISVTEHFTAGRYEREALARLDQLYKKHDLVICAGGTGLYLKALLEGLDRFPRVKKEIRSELEDELRHSGLHALQEELRQKDATYYQTVELENPARLLRALGVIRQSGKPFSYFLGRKKKKRPFKSLRFCLSLDREELYKRINERVDYMFEQGLVKEVRALLPYRDLKALNTVGYSELFSYLDGDLGLEECKELIKRNSRRYAKRQLTWFRNQGEWMFVPPDADELYRQIEKAIKMKDA